MAHGMIAISEGGLGAYWMARREDANVCAARLARCLGDLRTISPIFASWFYTKERARAQASIEPEWLRDLLLAGRNRKDFPPRQVIEELGFSANLITDQSVQEQLSFRVVCGMYASDPALLNHCLLRFAATGHLSDQALPLNLKTHALTILVESWDPDWAALRNRRLSKAVQAARGNLPVEPYFGWISYIARRHGALPQKVRDNYYCEALSTCGDLIYVTRDGFDDQSPRLIRAAADLYDSLESLLNRKSQLPG